MPARRLQAERPNQAWALDFMFDTTSNGRPFKVLSMCDEFTRESVGGEERMRIETAATSGTVEDLLRLLPGKGRLGVAAQFVGMQVDDYLNLVNQSLRGVDGLGALGASVRAAITSHLPPRTVPSSET